MLFFFFFGMWVCLIFFISDFFFFFTYDSGYAFLFLWVLFIFYPIVNRVPVTVLTSSLVYTELVHRLDILLVYYRIRHLSYIYRILSYLCTYNVLCLHVIQVSMQFNGFTLRTVDLEYFAILDLVTHSVVRPYSIVQYLSRPSRWNLRSVR